MVRHLSYGLRRLGTRAPVWRHLPNTTRILGHSPTLDLYTDEDLDEMIAAQKNFLTPWDSKPERPVNGVGKIVGRLKGNHHSLIAFE